jgi:hypothetical protein
VRKKEAAAEETSTAINNENRNNKPYDVIYNSAGSRTIAK